MILSSFRWVRYKPISYRTRGRHLRGEASQCVGNLSKKQGALAGYTIASYPTQYHASYTDSLQQCPRDRTGPAQDLRQSTSECRRSDSPYLDLTLHKTFSGRRNKCRVLTLRHISSRRMKIAPHVWCVNLPGIYKLLNEHVSQSEAVLCDTRGYFLYLASSVNFSKHEPSFPRLWYNYLLEIFIRLACQSMFDHPISLGEIRVRKMRLRQK
jgi:hypothetical protein